jgi:hypothetical protein
MKGMNTSIKTEAIAKDRILYKESIYLQRKIRPMARLVSGDDSNSVPLNMERSNLWQGNRD